MAPQFVSDTRNTPVTTTAVAIDKEKNSLHVVRWAIDHLVESNPLIFLIHVKRKHREEEYDSGLTNFFAPYRGFCAKRGIQTKEVILEEGDIVKSIVDYINKNLISNIVVGGKKNPIRRKFKTNERSTCLTKAAPSFCSVYVVRKGKIQSVRIAQRPIANTAAPPKIQSLPMLPTQIANDSSEDESKGHSTKGKTRNAVVPETTSSDGSSGGGPNRHKPPPSNSSLDSLDYSSRGRFSPGQDSISAEDVVFRRPQSLGSFDISSTSSQSTNASSSPDRSTTQNARELEAEMRKLKAELKKTMQMYSNVCKEALSAKKASELDKWKMEEARKMEEALARLAEEASRAIVETEKAKAEAAREAADASKRLAESEAQKRKEAEMQAKKEAEEKDRALNERANNDVRYRKYTIEEIEEATDKFERSNRVGEGGYGPVFKGVLDHTPVAIKLLRPDAAQGRKQFHQEVEILCSIRHPHLVLLLGACPEYGCLVYEYMSHGSLEDRLLRRGNTPPLSWRKRFKIAAEIATALSFLHQSKPEPLVHRDLKPANILLDRNYVSKISDVGLARLVPPSVADSVTQFHMTSAAGTFCYIDPEYQQTGRLTTKSDIYSLGIMLLQIITAKSPMGLSHHVESAIENGTFAAILDPTVPDWPVEEALSFAKMSLQCAELRKKERPDLTTVILPELERLSELGQEHEFSHRGTGRSGHGHSRNQTRRASASTSYIPTVHPKKSSASQEQKSKSADLEAESLKVNTC